MGRIDAIDLQQRFDELQSEAHREPVEIMREGKREFVLMSAEHYDWLRAAVVRSHRTEDAHPVVAEAVANATMAARHAHLDELMD